MYIVINGGGKVGSFLGRNLIEKGHHVAVIERRAEVLDKLAEEMPPDVLLIEGDGCDVRSQEDAGVGHAEVFVAVTGEDEDNLVSCQLAKVRFKVGRTVARVNSPKNEHIFTALGIEAISATTVIGRLIENEMSAGEAFTVHALKKGRLALVEMILPEEHCAVCHKRVSELELPRDTVLVALIQGEKVVVPKGDTVMTPGDRVIAVTSIEQEEELRRLLTGSRELKE
jgi:trk system potassium uptake protein